MYGTLTLRRWHLIADVLDIDLFDADTSVIDALHQRGRVVMCYVSVGTIESYRPDYANWTAANVSQPGVLGATVPNFPEEAFIDFRRTAQVYPLLSARFDLAVAKGCDGIDPVNVDLWQYSSADLGFLAPSSSGAA